MLKTSKPILTLGRLDIATINNQVLRIDGWVASFNSGSVNGFKLSLAGKEVTNFEHTLGIPSPDIKEAFPYLDSAENARFCIQVPLNQEQHQLRDFLIVLTPLFKGQVGGVLLTVLEPSLPKPSEEYINLVGSDFDVAFIFLAYFIQMSGLTPTDHVLDVGCGVGRLTYSLAYYLKPPGRYEGFDIIGNLIKWAQQNITPRFPHFNFRHVNIYNQMYNPTGTIQAPDFTFPYPDESFDFIFLTSVFTHMQAEEVRHYLDEIYRVLKPGGRCLCTCFLLNEESELAISQGRSSLQISHELEDCFTNDVAVPESAIGYKEALLLQWLEERDLTVTGKYYGYWCGRTCYTSMQDILIVEKQKHSNLPKQDKQILKGSPTYHQNKTLKPQEPLPTLGRLDVAVIENQVLRLQGWVASFDSGPVDGFKVSIAGREVSDFQLTARIPSPDVKDIYPKLESAENARFTILVPLTSQQQKLTPDSLVILTPLFKGNQGTPISTKLSFISHPETESKEVINNLPKIEQSQPHLNQIHQERASSLSLVQNIKADLERSRSYLQQVQANRKDSPSHLPQVQPQELPIAVENKLPSIETQNIEFYKGLLGLSEVNCDKFWQLIDPAIQAQPLQIKTTNPKISILTPTWNSSLDWFVETALSVLAQSISDWEWCLVDDGSKTEEIRSVLTGLAQKDPRIKVSFQESGGISSATNKALAMASGDYVCFLDHDDTLAQTALQESLDKLFEGFDVVYSDEDKIDFSGLNYVESFFKPDWSLEYFRGVMYGGHLLCVRRDLALTAGGLKSEFDGVQDYEFLLRISEFTNKIAHIPKILYHWRKINGSVAADLNAKPRIGQLQQAAVNSHLQRLGLPAKAEPGIGGHRVNINPLPRNQNPQISIVIAVKDTGSYLEKCLKSISSLSNYPNYELIIVEEKTTNSKTLHPNNQLSLKHLKLESPFNYSTANNLGAKSARGEYLVFLNNSTEVVTEDWLRHLLYYAEQPEVGAVGALLLFPDQTVQHAGIVLGGKSTVNYVMRGFPANSDGYAGSLVCAREVSAVADSCMMVKKSDFERVGGFNEHFVNSYQDVNLCLRLRKEGKRIIFTPRAVLITRESRRKQGYNEAIDRMLLLDQSQIEIEQGDPYFNANFDLELNDYTILG